MDWPRVARCKYNIVGAIWCHSQASVASSLHIIYYSISRDAKRLGQTNLFPVTQYNTTSEYEQKGQSWIRHLTGGAVTLGNKISFATLTSFPRAFSALRMAGV